MSTTQENTEKAIMKQEDQGASMVPSNWSADWKLAKIFAGSDLAPKDFRGKPENTFIAIQMGNEIGLKPLQAVQNIAVINGRPCVWGDAAIALIRNAQDFEYVIENEPKGDKDTDFAECILKRRGQPEVRRTFSWGDARRANLLSKDGTWKNYPKRMLQMRARGFCLRDGAADVLKGLAIREEVEDYQITIEDTPTDLMPKRVSEQTNVGMQDGASTVPNSPATKSESPENNAITENSEQDSQDKIHITEKQLSRLFTIASKNNITKEVVSMYAKQCFGIDSLRDLNRSDYNQICEWAEKGI